MTEQAYTIVGENFDGRTVYVSYQGEPPTEIQILDLIYDLVEDQAIQREVS